MWVTWAFFELDSLVTFAFTQILHCNQHKFSDDESDCNLYTSLTLPDILVAPVSTDRKLFLCRCQKGLESQISVNFHDASHPQSSKEKENFFDSKTLCNKCRKTFIRLTLPCSWVSLINNDVKGKFPFRSVHSPMNIH